MGIAGSLYDFRRNYKKKWTWPKLKFHGGGPKLKFSAIEDLPYEISEEHAALLLWQNGGAPESPWFSSKGYACKIKRFFGIGGDDDLTQYLLAHYNDLPRYSIPIATIENYMGDTSLLLTYPCDYCNPGKGREKKVWFYTWFHEEPPKDSELESPDLVATSISQLIKKLKPTAPKKFKSFDGNDAEDEDFDDDFD